MYEQLTDLLTTQKFNTNTTYLLTVWFAAQLC